MLTLLTADLGPTATYSRRSCAFMSDGSGWVAGPAEGEVIPAAGRLSIKVQRARGCGCKCDLDTYAVQVVGPGVFDLLNLTDPSQREPYRVTVGTGPETCRCKAGDCRVPSGCKHRDALAALIDLGAFDGPDEAELRRADERQAAALAAVDEKWEARRAAWAAPCPF